MTDLCIWTERPSELLTKFASLESQEVLALAKCGRFNGLCILFWGISEAQMCSLETIAELLGVQCERCEQSFFFDNLFYPSDDPYTCGAHDVEIDLWNFLRVPFPRAYNLIDPSKPAVRRIEEHSPREALLNKVHQVQSALAGHQNDPTF